MLFKKVLNNINLLAVYFFDIFSSYNFVENMNVSLPSNRILPYFKDILENAWSLQNYRDYFVEGLRQELCALESRKVYTKSDNQISIVAFFIYQNGKKCLHNLNSCVL